MYHLLNVVLYYFIYSKGITDSQQLHKAQQTVTILSVTLSSYLSLHIIMFIGSVDSKMVYFCLNNPITLSTCILTHESVREESTLSLLSCFLPLVKEGNLTSACFKATIFCIVNLRSAIIWSPGRR